MCFTPNAIESDKLTNIFKNKEKLPSQASGFFLHQKITNFYSGKIKTLQKLSAIKLYNFSLL